VEAMLLDDTSEAVVDEVAVVELVNEATVVDVVEAPSVVDTNVATYV